MPEWREVPGFPGYFASADGEIKSTRVDPGGRILKGGSSPNGYWVVALTRSKVSRTRTVHGVVAEAFLGARPEGQEIRHLDGDKLNNAARNLKYGTKRENQLDSIAHGTHSQASKTHCKYGHEFTLENTYVQPSRPNNRYCRRCHVDRVKAHRRRAAAK